MTHSQRCPSHLVPAPEVMEGPVIHPARHWGGNSETWRYAQWRLRGSEYEQSIDHKVSSFSSCNINNDIDCGPKTWKRGRDTSDSKSTSPHQIHIRRTAKTSPSLRVSKRARREGHQDSQPQTEPSPLWQLTEHEQVSIFCVLVVITLEHLGTSGMSEDETDIEEIPSRERGDPLHQRKWVRRVEPLWRSNDVKIVLMEIDHHYCKWLPVGKASPGNTPGERLLDATRTDGKRFICGLPHNVYDNLWLSQRTGVQWTILQVRPTWSPQWSNTLQVNITDSWALCTDDLEESNTFVIGWQSVLEYTFFIPQFLQVFRLYFWRP